MINSTKPNQLFQIIKYQFKPDISISRRLGKLECAHQSNVRRGSEEHSRHAHRSFHGSIGILRIEIEGREVIQCRSFLASWSLGERDRSTASAVEGTNMLS